MIFLANIGNTNLTYGLYHQERLSPSLFHQKRLASGLFPPEFLSTGRIPVQQLSHQRDAEILLQSLLEKNGLLPIQIAGCAISSVVPEKTPLLLNSLQKITSSEPLFVSSQTDWEFDVSSYSGVLGSDRLLCCSAALKKYQPPFIVVDFGTATTVNVVDPSGAFIGGVILPGVSTGLQALSVHTALLDKVSFFHPESVIGKNTAECMMSGATYGTASVIEGLVKRIRQELGAAASVIVTGGNAKAAISHCDLELHAEPNLLLEGLAIRFTHHKAVYPDGEMVL